MNYKLTDETIRFEESTLTRLIADSKDSNLSGWVESLDRISLKDSLIGQDAFLMGDVIIDDSMIGSIADQTKLLFKQRPFITDRPTLIKDQAIIEKRSRINENSRIEDQAHVQKSVIANSRISNTAFVCNSLLNHCEVSDQAKIFDAELNNCKISGNVKIYGASMIDALIEKPTDFMVFSVPKTESDYEFEINDYIIKEGTRSVPSRHRTLSFYRSSKKSEDQDSSSIWACLSDPRIAVESSEIETLADPEFKKLFKDLAMKAQAYIQGSN